MSRSIRLAALSLAVACSSLAAIPAEAQTSPNQQENAVTTRATGPFEVNMTPQETDAPLGRMRLDKTYHGELEATAVGEMLAAMTPVQGSAGYVAIERVTGTLAGRSGSFMLQHNGLMDRGSPSLIITVIPDSGTDELTGLTGTMNIVIENGQHTYVFDYTLPDAQ